MANPQLENGYTKIANELLEAICRLNISGNEMRILLFIIRRTYGFNCKSADISLSEISTTVGIRREHIQKILKRLSNKKIIKLSINRGIKPQTISIVKNYEQWENISVESCCNLLLQKTATVAEIGNTTVAEIGNSTYKEIYKESIKERKKEPAAAHFGEKKCAFVNDDNYIKLKKEYGADIVNKYISKVDKWAYKNNKNIGECSDYILKWLEQDNIQKVDPIIDEYYDVCISASKREIEESLKNCRE